MNEGVQVVLRRHDLVRSLCMNGDTKSYILMWCFTFSHLVLGSVSVALKGHGQDHGGRALPWSVPLSFFFIF